MSPQILSSKRGCLKLLLRRIDANADEKMVRGGDNMMAQARNSAGAPIRIPIRIIDIKNN